MDDEKMNKENYKEPYRSKQMRLFGRCTPPPLPKKYSIAKVRKRFDAIYNADVVKVPRLYKSSWQYYERYNVIDKATGKVLIEGAILFALGDYLDSQGEYEDSDLDIADGQQQND